MLAGSERQRLRVWDKRGNETSFKERNTKEGAISDRIKLLRLMIVIVTGIADGYEH
jgi:hypothetical protein